MEQESGAPEAMARFRRWGAAIAALAVLGYGAYAVIRGIDQTAAALASFRWPAYAGVLALTLVNYSLRYFKWQYLLGRLGVVVPHRANLQVFGTGLAMVITPGKAGELVKPWLIRTLTGAPMARTIPALVTERTTDGIAVVALAALGVGTWYTQGVWVVAATLAAIAAGLAVVASEALSMWLIGQYARIPVIGRLAGKLEEMVRALRTCLAPVPLAVTVLASMVAWFAECVGYWLVFRGLDVRATLEVATFLYAGATTFGGPSPGGMGISEPFLVEMALALVPDLDAGRALAAGLLIRLATLWFGVAIGAVALLRVDHLVRTWRVSDPGGEPGSPRPATPPPAGPR